MYGYTCEYCTGTVRANLVEHEAFKHKQDKVLLENIVVGICDECGKRYYSADILHTMHELAKLQRAQQNQRDLEILNCRAEYLNAEGLEALAYQAGL